MQIVSETVSRARLRYLGTSAQKTRLVIDTIRGLDVNRALARLGESPKSVSRDITKVLRSAVANAQKGDQRVDADTLYVGHAWVDDGPSMKRIRPATFGRAFRILKRSCHITLELESRPGAVPRLSRAKRRALEAREARKQASAGAAEAGKPDEKAPAKRPGAAAKRTKKSVKAKRTRSAKK